jgi:hypothetical protein
MCSNTTPVIDRFSPPPVRIHPRCFDSDLLPQKAFCSNATIPPLDPIQLSLAACLFTKRLQEDACSNLVTAQHHVWCIQQVEVMMDTCRNAVRSLTPPPQQCPANHSWLLVEPPLPTQESRAMDAYCPFQPLAWNMCHTSEIPVSNVTLPPPPLDLRCTDEEAPRNGTVRFGFQESIPSMYQSPFMTCTWNKVLTPLPWEWRVVYWTLHAIVQVVDWTLFPMVRVFKRVLVSCWNKLMTYGAPKFVRDVFVNEWDSTQNRSRHIKNTVCGPTGCFWSNITLNNTYQCGYLIWHHSTYIEGVLVSSLLQYACGLGTPFLLAIVLYAWTLTRKCYDYVKCKAPVLWSRFQHWCVETKQWAIDQICKAPGALWNLFRRVCRHVYRRTVRIIFAIIGRQVAEWDFELGLRDIPNNRARFFGRVVEEVISATTSNPKLIFIYGNNEWFLSNLKRFTVFTCNASEEKWTEFRDSMELILRIEDKEASINAAYLLFIKYHPASEIYPVSFNKMRPGSIPDLYQLPNDATESLDTQPPGSWMRRQFGRF